MTEQVPVAKKSLATELAEFLDPKARADVRHAAISHLNQLAVAQELSIFTTDDFIILKALAVLFGELRGERVTILSIFTNLTANSGVVTNYLIEKTQMPMGILVCIKASNPWATASGKLLANISRQFPEKALHFVEKDWPNYLDEMMDLLLKTDLEECADYLGYFMINISQIPKVRKILAVDKVLGELYPLVQQSEKPKRRLMAVLILRNLSFDDNLHTTLLDQEDTFLSAILTILMDEDYDLDDNEQSKLPVHLQYYDGHRADNAKILKKVIETLYQLCATKVGRTTLRAKGVYPLLREFDKATGEKPQGGMMVTDQEHTLHALIGVLIRYEEEMEVPSDLHSIRDL
uniref:Protein HGH1 homolog n=1 Tax=Rhabditophanes sp. KR3021 TaxID=114890 RepID=A0AC35TH27_9BILA